MSLPPASSNPSPARFAGGSSGGAGGGAGGDSASSDQAPGVCSLMVPPMTTWRRDEAVSFFTSALVCLMAGLKTEEYLFEPGFDWVRGLLLVFLWWLGLVSLVMAMDDRTRRWRIDLDGQGLRIERQGLLGSRQWRWRRAELVSVEGPSTHHRPALTPTLTIVSADGQRRGLPVGRHGQETAEIARRLREALRAPPPRGGT